MLPEFCQTELRCLFAIWQKLNVTTSVPVTLSSSTPDIILILFFLLLIILILILIWLIYYRVRTPGAFLLRDIE